MLGPRSSRLAAFAAGIVFTFSPFHVAHLLGHMQVISLEWMPFFALYLLRTVDSGMETGSWKLEADDARHATPHAPRPVLRNGVLAAFFLILVALCDWYYVLYCLIFTAVVAFGSAVPRFAGHAPLRKRSASPTASRGARSPAPLLLRTLATITAIWLLWAAALSPVLVPMIREARAVTIHGA